MFENVVNMAVSCYCHILEGALPATLVIGLSGVLVHMIFSAAFGGNLSIGGDPR